jgi:hypothetical protein
VVILPDEHGAYPLLSHLEKGELMVRNIMIRVALVLGLGVGVAAAQTASVPLGSVRITQPVLANGKPLAPGTYEVRLTDEFLSPNPGQSPDAERVVEFVKDGQVVGRDAAEVVTTDGSAVGTSGRAAVSSKPRVELLKGGEFIRVSATREGMRYLIHLPVLK